MTGVLRHYLVGASVPLAQHSVQTAGGHQRRRLLPLQVNKASLEERGVQRILRPKFHGAEFAGDRTANTNLMSAAVS